MARKYISHSASPLTLNGEGLCIRLHLSRHCSSSRKVSSLARPYDRAPTLRSFGDLGKATALHCWRTARFCAEKRRYPSRPSIRLSLTTPYRVTGYEADQSVWSPRVRCVTVHTWPNKFVRLPASTRYDQVIRRMTRQMSQALICNVF